MKLLAILLLSATCAWAAIPAGAVWEFRQGATPLNLNGGFYNAARGGVDYSQQDAAQLTATDGVAAGTTTFTSVTGGFTDPMKGNGIQLFDGVTRQIREIVSVTDGNTIELDASPGTSAGIDFYVGGALSLNSTFDNEALAAMVSGNIGFVKYSASQTEFGETAITLGNGTGTLNIRLVGYDSTRTVNNTDANKPRWNFTGAEQILFGNNWRVRNMYFTGISTYVAGLGTDGLIRDCKIINGVATDNLAALQVNTGCTVLDNEIMCSNGNAVSTASSSSVLIEGNTIKGSNNGVNPSVGANISVRFNTFIDCKNSAMTTSATTARNIFEHNTVYGAEATPNGSGIITTGATSLNWKIRFNIFRKLAAGITIGTVEQASIFEDWNCFSGNTTDRTLIETGANSITTDPAFTGVTQIAGSGATSSGTTITHTGQFGTVVAGDWVRIVSGTGVTIDTYLITAADANTLTVNNTPGTATDIVYVVYTQTNLLPTASLPAYPGAFPGSDSTGFNQMGAVLRNASGGGGEHSFVF